MAGGLMEISAQFRRYLCADALVDCTLRLHLFCVLRLRGRGSQKLSQAYLACHPFVSPEESLTDGAIARVRG